MADSAETRRQPPPITDTVAKSCAKDKGSPIPYAENGKRGAAAGAARVRLKPATFPKLPIPSRKGTARAPNSPPTSQEEAEAFARAAGRYPLWSAEAARWLVVAGG